MRIGLGLAAMVIAVAATVAMPPAAATGDERVLGSDRPARGTATVRAGTAWAVQRRAAADRRVTAFRIAAGARTRARRVAAALYATRRGRPGRLLARGRARTARGRLRIRLPGAPIRAGRRYWLAVVPIGGRLVARRARGRRCRTVRATVGATPPRRLRAQVRRRSCGPLLFATGPGGGAPAPPAPSQPPGDQPASRPPLSAPPPAVVDAARRAPLMRYGRGYPGGAFVNEGWGGGASMVLASAAYAGDVSADGRLLEQIRETVSGGHEPVANGGYPAQHERWVTGMLAVARHTPRVWSQLTAAERRRADLVMTGALVASAFTTGDANPYLRAGTQQYTLDGDANVNRDWNPNMREGMVGMTVVGGAYFGSGAAAQAVLDGYRHGDFLAAVRAAGLANLAETFSWRTAHPSSPAPTAAQIEATVRGYRYYGLGLASAMAIFRRLSVDTYGGRVACGLDGGRGIATPHGQAGLIVQGCAGLPSKGAAGMLKEFDVIDANGARSSAYYSYDGYRGNLTNHLAMVAGGLWRAGPDADAILARLRVGVPDLWYKLDRGYRGYAKGSIQWIPDASEPYVMRSDNPNFAFGFSRSLWEDVLRRHHGI